VEANCLTSCAIGQAQAAPLEVGLHRRSERVLGISPVGEGSGRALPIIALLWSGVSGRGLMLPRNPRLTETEDLADAVLLGERIA
jgi:hypothetical protein